MVRRIRMHLTENETELIRKSRDQGRLIRERKAVLERQKNKVRCSYMISLASQCPMGANPKKDGMCGGHYNKVHGLMQWKRKKTRINKKVRV